MNVPQRIQFATGCYRKPKHAFVLAAESMFVLCTLLLLSIHSLLKRQNTVELHEAKTAEHSEKTGKNSRYTRRRKVGNPVRGGTQGRCRSCSTTQLEVLECNKRAQVRDWSTCAHRESSIDVYEQIIEKTIVF